MDFEPWPVEVVPIVSNYETQRLRLYFPDPEGCLVREIATVQFKSSNLILHIKEPRNAVSYRFRST